MVVEAFGGLFRMKRVRRRRSRRSRAGRRRVGKRAWRVRRGVRLVGGRGVDAVEVVDGFEGARLVRRDERKVWGVGRGMGCGIWVGMGGGRGRVLGASLGPPSFM